MQAVLLYLIWAATWHSTPGSVEDHWSSIIQKYSCQGKECVGTSWDLALPVFSNATCQVHLDLFPERERKKKKKSFKDLIWVYHLSCYTTHSLSKFQKSELKSNKCVLHSTSLKENIVMLQTLKNRKYETFPDNNVSHRKLRDRDSAQSKEQWTSDIPTKPKLLTFRMI